MSAWKELGISLRAKLHGTCPEEPWGVEQTVTYPKERLGEVLLKFVDTWVTNSTIITEVTPAEIPYSLTETPIFQKMWKEDYNYYGSIPNM